MTLKITSNKIYIQNPSGVTKFDSDNHLMYRIGYASGSINLNSSTPSVSKSLGFSIEKGVIHVINITVTSCSGSIGSTMINVRTPLTGAIPIDWYGFQDGTWVVSIQENLEVVASGNSIHAHIKQYNYYDSSNSYCRNGVVATSFNYEVHAYKHQDIQ